MQVSNVNPNQGIQEVNTQIKVNQEETKTKGSTINSVFDSNKDGTITTKEQMGDLSNMASSLKENVGNAIKALFAQIQTDGSQASVENADAKVTQRKQEAAELIKEKQAE